jgi:lipoprotein-anchoring transpeptidase ErfK/SrfK
VLCLVIAVALAACGGGGGTSTLQAGKAGEQRSGGSASRSHATGSGHGSSTTPSPPQITITPSGGVDRRPDRGLTVTAAPGAKLTNVRASDGSKAIAGTLNAAGTAWHSTWALGVDAHYTVTATGTGTTGAAITRTVSFHTFQPKHTFVTQIIEGYRQNYGVGMPIILYFDQTITNRTAIEKALQVTSSKPVTGSWYWDNACGSAPTCAYFRPHHYWPAHTTVGFTGHLDGVQGAPGVYGFHTLTQSFNIDRSLTVVASTSDHHMTVRKDGRVFATWPISTGRPGDDTPNGSYLTIDKGNPVDMKGPGYNIQVPWSVRFTWSGDYLHDAYWSTGQQGFTNVSHGCVNMPPADAEIYYKMELPGDPVKIVGSPRAGVFDNGWTMWFLPWNKWLEGSALHKAVRANAKGSFFFHPHV